MTDGEFNLLESFDVDGKLDRFPRELCFVLGVEWQMIYQELEIGQPFERPIHSENLERVEAMCVRRDRKYSIGYHDDWPNLVVE